MSKSISFRDLKLLPMLANLNEVQMLSPHLDSLINSFLGDMAFDMDYPILYVPCVHRDMRNKVALGFMAVGEVSINRHDINSIFSDTTDRLIAASYQDTSLADALNELSVRCPDYAALSEDTEDEVPFFTQEIWEDDWQGVEKQIATLAALRDTIRGSAYNDAGALKMPEEYYGH